ncbi:MAG TPA: CPBP family intramembrane glutamic endopeptidase [Gemmatimonadales bacterium]|nr:CPBP family intramembrane glutamic endopeptidase [Gemmatimonadales bacterium]
MDPLGPARLPHDPRSDGAPGRLTTKLRDALRDGRFLAAEVAIAIGLLACGLIGLFPFGGTPGLVAFGALSLWLRREGPRGVGLQRAPPSGWRRVVLLGLTAGVGYQLLSLYVVEPLTARFIGRLPDVSMFASLKGNLHLLFIYLALSWTLAGFGEEFVYRGYLLNRIAQLLGGRRRAWLAGLGATTVLFGLGHGYQGASGVIDTGLFGLLFGALYILGGRNLWVSVIAHGVADTTAFALLFFGRYPGV